MSCKLFQDRGQSRLVDLLVSGQADMRTKAKADQVHTTAGLIHNFDQRHDATGHFGIKV
jgi:hypothetical protein